ncbi:MAG: hypothetical protein JSS76_15630 [Bacteroidetes bacterium]|nr:hypothetical protein [Bacteroidota bacterium]MBS1686175.1 hypothetical protein [Bacteroidota bacterium]
MEFERGQWIIDQKNKKPIWVTAVGLEGTFVMGWGLRRHTPYWCTASAPRDAPRVMSDGEVAAYIESECDVEGMTYFKTIMKNPDDYMFKSISRYGTDDKDHIRRCIEDEHNTRKGNEIEARRKERMRDRW